ncbi:hypothetical protein [Nocardia acididurans]|uniref:hypothetical protein n=1 Tax=Nocardia acididurans TaxID=2802282 RepID=UPI001E5C9474|nr:hypothetical protein [Nocardia acididurans]
MAFGLFVAGLGVAVAVAKSDRYYRFDWIPAWLMPLCWTGAIVVLVLGPAVCGDRQRVWVSFAALLGLVTIPLWVLTMFALMWDDGSREVKVTVSADGRHELVTEYFHNTIDPSCRVWLRERDGLFARQTLVWKRIEANCPTSVEFWDDSTIGITEYAKREPFKTTFDADRMEVAKPFTLP